MLLGIPRGHFYYDYYLFADRLFRDSGIEILYGCENSEDTLKRGRDLAVDEACVPMKLVAGQLDYLEDKCDRILLPRVMKDYMGRWLCPKLLGLPELMSCKTSEAKYLITEPLKFNDKKDLSKRLWKVCSEAGMKRAVFTEAFEDAYGIIADIAGGRRYGHTEAGWEFAPQPPRPGEIILPNNKKIFLAGHCYTVYDRFINMDIVRKLDEFGITVLTEKDVLRSDAERCVRDAGLVKPPYWEAFVRLYGAALHMRDKVDGIIYISSFSCGLDSFIIEMIKTHITDVPMMVLKLDEHRGRAGFETRLEAFSDLLQRSAS